MGEAGDEFVARGYELDCIVGLIASAQQIVHHPRANRDVSIRSLEVSEGPISRRGASSWSCRSPGETPILTEDEARGFYGSRAAEYHARFRGGGGAWYVAIDTFGTVVASCAVVVDGQRAGIQSVETAPSHRRRGISSRLVVDAAHDAARRHGSRDFVIAADPNITRSASTSRLASSKLSGSPALPPTVPAA